MLEHVWGGCLRSVSHLVTGFLRTVGEELRRARRDAGLALRDLNQRSGHEFKASAVGGYERGERSISLDRFCRLAALYGVTPDSLLARVVARIGVTSADDVVIDIRLVQAGDSSEPVPAGLGSEAQPS